MGDGDASICMSIFSFFGIKPHQAESAESSDESEHVTRYGCPVAGDVLVLEFIQDDKSNVPPRYQATIEAVGLRRLMLGPIRPLVPGLPSNPFVTKRQAIRVTYSRGSTLYRFDARPIPCGRDWALLRPRRVVRIERRGYYRMMVETPTSYKLIGDSKELKLSGRIANLSAGGLLLCTPTEIRIGQRIMVAVPVGKSGYVVDIAGDVLDTSVHVDRGRASYMARVRFVSTGQLAICPETREEIVTYIFEQQRLMLRTRKLMQGA